MLHKYSVLIAIGGFTFLTGSINCKDLNTEITSRTDVTGSNGPAWVTKVLSENGVFKTPFFEFTKEYDRYNQYPNIRGLFFNGLPYHGKPTKVFCWYGVPETTQKGGKAPAVVLVHGGEGTVFPEWVKKVERSRLHSDLNCIGRPGTGT